MKILFLDQSGKLGGAELCLLDIAKLHRDRSLVGLFADGSFREQLEQHQIPVRVLTTKAIQVRKDSSLLQGLSSFGQLLPLISRVVKLSRDYDLIYTNTQKALIVGAIASALSRRPFVHHLHDIVSDDHFSSINRRLIVSMANLASLVIANSEASQKAFVAAGGRAPTQVVYNGFDPELYKNHQSRALQSRQALRLEHQFVVGHFSRLSPWKGQHVLIDALQHCPSHVVAVLVGDALFGEEEYVAQLHRQVAELGLGDRVHFLGFRSDIPELMSACNLVAHTSTAPEPFGRVIVEAMLCGTPVVAAEAGGAVELVEQGKTGWLCPPNAADHLADVINHCINHPDQVEAIAQHAQTVAMQRFNLTQTNQQIADLLDQLITKPIHRQ